MRWIIISCLFFGSCVAYAQPEGPPPGRPFERIERLRKVRLIEALDLSEDQSVRFFARLNERDETRRAIFKEKGEALDKVERLVRNHADAKEFEALFSDVAAIDTRMADESRRFFDGLKDILSAEQRGKLLLFEKHFERELREAMKEAQRRRHGMEEP
jgi:hypothetical protein